MAAIRDGDRSFWSTRQSGYEPLALFRDRLRDLGMRGRELFVEKPQFGLPTVDAFLEELDAQIRRHGIELVVLDPMTECLRVQDENDAAEMSRTLRPFHALTQETGCTILFIHHDRKAEGKGVDLLRGSSAIGATFDFILQLRYLRGDDRPERALQYMGRYGRGVIHARFIGDDYELIDHEALVEEQRETKNQQRAEKRESRRQKDFARARRVLREHPDGLDRQTAAAAIGIGVNRVTALLNGLVGSEARHEPNRGSSPGKWFLHPQGECVEQ